MTDKKPSNPALFHWCPDRSTYVTSVDLRDLFAAFALTGMLNKQTEQDQANRESGQLGFKRLSEASYSAADTMLAEREK